jgi:hypothetical protein
VDGLKDRGRALLGDTPSIILSPDPCLVRAPR